MKFAVFGDIHANLEALTAVLLDAQSQGVTQYVCTGDLVGYNANPHECLQIVRSMDCPVVMGNHDEEAVSDDPILGMNPLAREAMMWTRTQLTPDDKSWLRSLPLVRRFDDFTLVHASLEDPGHWPYVLSRFDAAGSFVRQQTRLCFHGHTHRCRYYAAHGRALSTPDIATPLRIAPEGKYLVNAGSVGLSRDGDKRAAYVIYDQELNEVEIRRVPWDYDSFESSLRRTPLWPLMQSRMK